MTKKQQKVLWRIIATAVLVAVVKLFSIGGVAGTVLYLAAYLIIGYDILRKAFRGIIKGQVFDENFLMAVATVGAIALAVYEKSGDYLEAVAVMLHHRGAARREDPAGRRSDGGQLYPEYRRPHR